MKIQKFNENMTQHYHIAIIICGNEIQNSGVFETEEDMNNWILNKVNERLSQYPVPPTKRQNPNLQMAEDGELVFINVDAATIWFNDDEWSIFKSESVILKNITALYGVELLRDTNKYNL